MDPTIDQTVLDNMITVTQELLDLGIVHKNVHGGNFLVDENKNVKIIDFEYVEFL